MDANTPAPVERATLTRDEVSVMLGVDPRTVSKGIADGTIPGIRLGNRVVIPRQPLLAMLHGTAAE